MGAKTGMEIPYIIKFSIKDDDIRKSLSQIDWEEELGLNKGKIITDALKSDAKTASDAIERELGGTNINWKKILGEELFKKIETKITQNIRVVRDNLKDLIDANDMKGVKDAIDLITQLGKEFKELGGDFNAKSLFTSLTGLTTKINGFREEISELKGTIEEIKSTFGVTFDDNGKIVKATKDVEGLAQAIVSIGKNKSASKRAEQLRQELDSIFDKPIEIDINYELDEKALVSKLQNKLTKLERIEVGQVLSLDELLDEDIYYEIEQLSQSLSRLKEFGEGTSEYVKESTQLLKHLKTIGSIEKRSLSGKDGRSLLEEFVGNKKLPFWELNISDLNDLKEEIKYIKESLKAIVEETVARELQGLQDNAKDLNQAAEQFIDKLGSIDIKLSLTEKNKDIFRNEINDYIKALNDGGHIETVKVKAVLDKIRKDNPDKEVPEIEGEGKGAKPIKNDEDKAIDAYIKKAKGYIKSERTKLEGIQKTLQDELQKLNLPENKPANAQGWGIKVKNLEKQIAKYEDLIKQYVAIEDLMADRESAFAIASELDGKGDSFSRLETRQKAILAKTETWKQEMIKALTFSSSDLDGKFDFEDAGEQLYNAINSYLSDDAHKLLVKVDAKHIADQVSGILNASGINLGGGGNVNLDAKELGNIIASVMQSVLTGAPMPTFDSAPQEQQADVMEEVAKETTDATETTVKYVHSVDDSTIGLEHLIDTLKKLTTVANGVKFENGKNVPTASKDIRAFAEWLTGRGINILPNEKNKYQTLETMDDAEIKTMIQNALFTQLKDLSAKGGTLPSDIEDWISGRFKKGVKFKDGSVVDVLGKAFKEIFVNNGVPTESSEARIKRQDAINAFVRSAMSGAAYNKLNSVRGGLYPGNDEIKRIPSADKIQEVIDFFGQLVKMTNPDAAIIQERANNLSRQIVELESSLSGAELTEQQQILTSLKEQLTPLISTRDEIVKEQENEQKKFYTDRDEEKIKELQEKKGAVNKQINDLLAQINPIESWIKNNADRYVDVAKLQQELDELKQQKNPDVNTKQKIDDLSSKISKAETWRRNTQDLITSKKQQLLNMQESADIFDTTELYRLKAAREVLGDNVDAESKGKFKEVADEFWNATERVVKGLQTLNGELEARVVVAGRTDAIDITSPKQGAKLLQEGVHITHAEIYNDAAKTPIDDSFIGSTQYRNSSKSKSKRIEQGILNSGGKPSYYSDKPEDFGIRKKVDILDEKVNVAEFKPETLVIEGKDVDLEGEIAKTHQNIERNKAELQAVEAESQQIANNIKKSQINVTKKTNAIAKTNVAVDNVDTVGVERALNGNKLKQNLLSRISKGEMLNPEDEQYNKYINELYPDIYKKMQDINNVVKERQLKENQLNEIANLTEKEATRRLEQFKEDKRIAEIHKDPASLRGMSDEYRSQVEQAIKRANNEAAQSFAKIYQDFLNDPKATQTALKSSITRLKNKEANQRSVVQEWAKSEINKMPQAMDEIQKKAKPLMSKFKAQINDLFNKAVETGSQLSNKDLSKQKKDELTAYLYNIIETIKLTEAQYEEFAKKVNLSTVKMSASRKNTLNGLSETYLGDAQVIVNDKQQALKHAEEVLVAQKRLYAEKEIQKKQLEEDTTHQEQNIQRYEAQKAKQGEINVLLEKRLVLQENINELIRQNASQDEIDAERGKLAFIEQQINDIYAELEKTGGHVKTERKFNTTKEAIQSDVLKSVVEYDKEIKTLTAQKFAYERKMKELDDRKSKHVLAGAVIDKKAKYQEDWKEEYMRSGADVIKAETELRDNTKLTIQNLIEPIEADYQNKVNNLFSNFNKNVADAMKSKGLDHTNKNIKEDFLASDNIGKYLAQTYADQRANLEDTKNNDIANITRQEWDKYETKLKELRTRMRDNFVKTIQVAGDVVSVTFDKLDAEGNVTTQSYNKNVKQEILDQIKKEKDELKAEHKPSEIESKLEAAKKYRAEALQAGEFSEGVLLNPQAAKEQIDLVTQLLSISDKLYEKQQELKAYEDAGLNGKDKNVRNLRKEIKDLTEQKTEKEREIANRDEVLARELLEKSNKTSLTTEEKLAEAIKRRSKLQENLIRSTDILAKKQEEYNAAKGTEGAEKAWVALEKAKKFKQKRQDELDAVDASIERLTAKSTTETQIGSTSASGTTAQGGLVGAIVSAIKESLGAVDTQGVATEETLRKIYGLLGGDYQPEGGVSRNKKGAKTAYDILKEAMSGFDSNMSKQEKQAFYESRLLSAEVQEASNELIRKDNNFTANSQETALLDDFFKLLDAYISSGVVIPSQTETRTALNAKELNKAAYDQTKDIVKNITDEKSAVDAVTKSVERLKQLTNENKQDTEEYIIEQRKLGTILAKSYFPMNPKGVKGTGKDGALKWEDLKANDATLKKLGVWDYNPLTSNKALEALVDGDKPAKQDNNQKELEALDSRISTLNSKLEQILPLIEANPEAKGIAEEVKTEITKLEADRQKLVGGAKDKTNKVDAQKQDKKESKTKDFKAEVKSLITEIDKHKTGSKEQEPLQKALYELIKEWRASGKLGEKGVTGKQLASALAKHGIKNIDSKKYALTGNQLNKLFPGLKTTTPAKKDTPVIPTTKPTPTTSQASAGGLLGIMQNKLAQDITLQQILTEIRSGWRDNVNNGIQQIINAETNGNKEIAALINSETGATSGYVEGNEDNISKDKLEGLLASGSGKFDTFMHSHGDVKDPFFSKDDLDLAAEKFANGITKSILKNGKHITMLDMSDVKDLSGLIEALKNTKQTHKALTETAAQFGAKYTHTAFRTDKPENLMKMLGISPVTAKSSSVSATTTTGSDEISDIREIPKEFMRTQNRISKYADVFKYAKSEGWLLEDGDKKFQESKKNLDELIARYEKGENVLQKLKDAYTATAEAGAEVNRNVNANKRLYSGTNELRSAQRQRDKIAGQYGVDFDFDIDKTKVNKEDMSLLELYEKKYQDLITLYDKYAKNRSLNDTKHQEKLREESALVQKLGRKYMSEAAEQDRLKDLADNSSTFINSQGKEIKTGGFHVFSDEELANKTAAMRAYAEAMYGAEAANFKLDKKTMTLNGTIRENDKVVHDVAIKYNEAAQGAYAFEKAEREHLTGWPAFKKGLWEKTKAISQYLVSMTSIYRVFGEFRKGIQYIKEIDAALVELRKVTDETEETYDEFLNTASKTASKLGSTISAVTEATATFAKLGYTMEMSSVMAEAAIVYKNVGDNITSTEDAANSIISTLKGFGLEASEAMRIVDRFNEVGNKFAITSQGIGEALRLSASALNEGGNTLDESIGIITAANEVVNDPSSVGTALKTLTLRLRGSKTELEEMGEDVSDMATTTSQLQAKLLALTGGKVDIMLDANTFKSSTQILREMSAAWEDMTDIQRASALELMGGKRQANILSALITNFDTAEKAIEASANSAGSALKENEVYLDSIQGKIDLLTNATQTMWSNLLDSDTIKGFISLATTLVQVLDALNPLNVAFVGLFAFLEKKYNLLGNIFKPAGDGVEELKKQLVKAEAELTKATQADVQHGNKKTAQNRRDAEERVAILKSKIQESSSEAILDGIDESFDPSKVKKSISNKKGNITKRANKLQAEGKTFAEIQEDPKIKQWTQEVKEGEQALNDYNAKVAQADATLKQKNATTTQAAGAERAKAGAEATDTSATNAGANADRVATSEENKKTASTWADVWAIAAKEGATWGDVAASAAQLIKTKLLNSAFIQNAILMGVMTKEEALNMTVTQLLGKGFIGLGKSIWAATKQMIAFLLTNPIGQMMLLAGVLIGVGVAIASVHKNTKELKEELDGFKSKLSDIRSELDSVNSELETTNERMEELLAKDKLTFEEQEELDRLRETNDELERRKELLETEEEYKAGLVGRQAAKVVDSKKNDEDWWEATWIWGPFAGLFNNEGDEVKNRIKDYKDLQDKYNNASSLKEKENLQKKLDKKSGQIDAYIGELSEALDGVEYGDSKESDAALDYLSELQDTYGIARGSASAKTNAIKSIMRKDEFSSMSKAIDYYVQTLKDGDENATDNISEIINGNADFVEELKARGLEAQDAIDLYNKLGSNLSFNTLEGKIAELKLATEKLPDALNNIEQFMDGDEVDTTVIADYFRGTSEETRNEIAKLIQQINKGEISIENALKQFELFGIQSTLKIEITEVQTNFKEIFTDLEDADGLIDTFNELADAIGSTSNALDALNAAQAEMKANGRVSIETALKLMEYTDDYSKVLTISEGKLILNKDAEENLIEARIENMKASALKALEDSKAARETIVLARSNAEAALSTYNSALETEIASAVTVTAWDKVLAGAAGLLAGIKSLFTSESWTEAYDRAYQDVINTRGENRVTEVKNKYASAEELARRAQLEDDIEAADKALEEQDKEIGKLQGNYDLINGLNKDNIGDVFKSDGYDTVEDVAKEELQKLLDYYDNRLSANQAKQEQLQNEIELAEKMGMKADKSYYDEKLKLMAEQEALLQQKKADLLVELNKIDDVGSDEWFQLKPAYLETNKRIPLNCWNFLRALYTTTQG